MILFHYSGSLDDGGAHMFDVFVSCQITCSAETATTDPGWSLSSHYTLQLGHVWYSSDFPTNEYRKTLFHRQDNCNPC